MLIATITMTSLGLLLHFNDGFESRLNYGEDFGIIEKSPMRDRCHSINTPCEFFEGLPKFATFGDSHVVELSYALAEHLKPNGYSVQQNSYTSCLPNLRKNTPYCFDWTTKVIDRIINNKDIEVVVVSFSLATVKPEKLEIALDDLQIIIEKFSENEKKVFFLIQPPLLESSIQKQILLTESNDIFGPNRIQWMQTNNLVYSFVKNLHENVVVFDIADVFCDDIRCYGKDNNGYYYYDNNHISLYGAKKIVEYLSVNFNDFSL